MKTNFFDISLMRKAGDRSLVTYSYNYLVITQLEGTVHSPLD